MVKAATSYSRSGVRDWLLQRASAIVLLLYTASILFFLLCTEQVTFQLWQEYIRSTPMRVFSVLALLSILVHGWIGLWTVATDYIKPCALRMAFHFFYTLLLIAMLVWGIDSLWF